MAETDPPAGAGREHGADRHAQRVRQGAAGDPAAGAHHARALPGTGPQHPAGGDGGSHRDHRGDGVPARPGRSRPGGRPDRDRRWPRRSASRDRQPDERQPDERQDPEGRGSAGRQQLPGRRCSFPGPPGPGGGPDPADPRGVPGDGQLRRPGDPHSALPDRPDAAPGGAPLGGPFDSLAGRPQHAAGTPLPGAPRPTQARLNPKYSFDNFVIGASTDRFAHAAAVAVAEAPAKAYNPLFIYGESGLGKTHLLHAIGHYAISLYPGIRVRYVASEEFTNNFINSIPANNRASVFQSRYREIDILLIDDIQFLQGKDSTQEAFFHTFNTLHDHNKQVVITSDLPPKHLGTGFEDRMRSRFEWGLITDVQAPDLETRIAILRKKAGQNEKLCIESATTSWNTWPVSRCRPTFANLKEPSSGSPRSRTSIGTPVDMARSFRRCSKISSRSTGKTT